MKRQLLVLSVAAAIAAPAAMAESEGKKATKLVIVPSIGYVTKNLDFKEKLTNSLGESVKGDLDVDVPVIQLGLALGYGDFGFAVKYEDSNDDIVASTDVPEAGPQTRVSREDISFTLNYKVSPSFSVFVGYMKGETEFTPLPFTGTDGLGGIEEDGLFYGAAYGIPFKELGGKLTFSVAFADLDGSYEDNYLPDQDGDFDFEGDSTGLSLAVSWSGKLSKNVGYSLDLRKHSFEMDGKDKSGNFLGSKVETEEDITSMSASVRYIFR